MNFLVLQVFAMLHSFAVFGSDSIVYPQDYFRAPLAIPLTLSGNFGEPRGTHFHTGLDFKTNSEEGLRVYAAADGYITRINVSPSGYGNALYVRHPNGWVTVYGHLKEFAPQIMERLRKEQYAKQSFSVDFSLPASEIPVKKGEVIAYSGNTGSSGGPHLHFEIRDIYDHVFNPQLFGIPIKDEVKPEVSSLEFYALDSLKGKSKNYRVKLYEHEGIYQPKEHLLKLNASSLGFSVNTLDRMTGSSNTLGIYNMTVFDNDKMIYEYQQDKLSFSVTRYVLSQIDYSIYKNESQKIFHKCFVEPGNQCPIYSNLVNRGVVDLSDGLLHKIGIEVQDFAGNTSFIKFDLRFDSNANIFTEKDFNYATKLNYNRVNEFSTADIKLNFPEGCLFDDVYFTYAVDSTPQANIFSKIYEVGSSDIPLFGRFTIAVKAENLPSAWQSKALLTGYDKKGNLSNTGGEFQNGFVVSKVREFGKYYVMIDTVPPKIVPLNVSPGKNMRGQKRILVKISDNLSGIAGYDTYIDGKWTVTDFDAKSATLTHSISNDLPKGEHLFKVVVTDDKKNRAAYSVKFNW